MVMDNNHGIWIGKDAAIAITEKLQILFLRLQKDKIISILKQIDKGIVGIVYGYGIKSKAHCDIGFKGKAGQSLIDMHSEDKIIRDGKRITYKMYDGTEFNCVLAEKIILSDSIASSGINNDLSIAKRQELWNLGTSFGLCEDFVTAGIDTHKYSVLFSLSCDGNKIYCRVGQNGYCEKGRAMLSTVCLRPKEVRMLENNLDSLNEFKPMLDKFVEGSCSFPTEGSWYWSLKETTDDYILLHGCGGAIYKTNRSRNGKYEIIV